MLRQAVDVLKARSSNDGYSERDPSPDVDHRPSNEKRKIEPESLEPRQRHTFNRKGGPGIERGMEDEDRGETDNAVGQNARHRFGNSSDRYSPRRADSINERDDEDAREPEANDEEASEQ